MFEIKPIWHWTVYKQKTIQRLNWIVWNRTVYCIKMDLALNNLQRLICHKTQTNKHYPLDRLILKTWIVVDNSLSLSHSLSIYLFNSLSPSLSLYLFSSLSLSFSLSLLSLSLSLSLNTHPHTHIYMYIYIYIYIVCYIYE